jgi:hypothetical protein
MAGGDDNPHEGDVGQGGSAEYNGTLDTPKEGPSSLRRYTVPLHPSIHIGGGTDPPTIPSTQRCDRCLPFLINPSPSYYHPYQPYHRIETPLSHTYLNGKTAHIPLSLLTIINRKFCHFFSEMNDTKEQIGLTGQKTNKVHKHGGERR